MIKNRIILLYKWRCDSTMIIRLTVNDSEFTDILEKFANNIVENLIASINFDTDDYVGMEKEFERCHRIINIFKLGQTNEATDNEKGYLIQQIRNAFAIFVEGKRKSTYLINNISITVTDSMTDIDENKEVVYWFCNSRKVIIQ